MTASVLDTQVIRKRLGDGKKPIPQSAFAAIAQVDQSAVSLWETDKTSPSRAVQALITQHCKARGIKLAWKNAPPKREPPTAMTDKIEWVA